MPKTIWRKRNKTKLPKCHSNQEQRMVSLETSKAWRTGMTLRSIFQSLFSSSESFRVARSFKHLKWNEFISYQTYSKLSTYSAFQPWIGFLFLLHKTFSRGSYHQIMLFVAYSFVFMFFFVVMVFSSPSSSQYENNTENEENMREISMSMWCLLLHIF